MKTKRFFYHYNKASKRLTVHYDNKCTPVDNVICNVPTESKWNKQQPLLVIQGHTAGIEIKQLETGLTAIIN